MQRTDYIQIAQLQPNQNSLNLHFIVLECGNVIRTMNGDALQTLRVADGTGSVNLTIRIPECIDALKPSDIMKLRNGYTNIFKGCLTLNAGRASECLRIGEFFFNYVEYPCMSEFNPSFAAIERARKGSPPEDGEVLGSTSSAPPNDPRRSRNHQAVKRPFPGGRNA